MVDHMAAVQTYDIFGDTVEVFVDSSMSGGRHTVIVHTAHPGGGPPPHRHRNEDETFCVLEGQFELFGAGQLTPLSAGVPVFSPRGTGHTFRNAGTTPGTILIIISPAGFESFLEGLSGLNPVSDMPKILALADRFEITFL
jgi:quercetin dioxygenase-like cupin family protein